VCKIWTKNSQPFWKIWQKNNLGDFFLTHTVEIHPYIQIISLSIFGSWRQSTKPSWSCAVDRLWRSFTGVWTPARFTSIQFSTNIYIAQWSRVSRCAPEATLKSIRLKFTPVVSNCLHRARLVCLDWKAQRWKWVSGSWVTASDPLTHDDEITAQ